MSFEAGVTRGLNRVHGMLSTHQSSAPQTVVVPAQAGQVEDGGVILMDHPLLPTPTPHMFLDNAEPVQAHDLGIGLAYECFQQSDFSGGFHVTGPPGLFCIALNCRDLEVEVEVYRAYNSVINAVDDFTDTSIKSPRSASVFLNTEDVFLFRYRGEGSTVIPANIYASITRITTVDGFVPQAPYVD